MNNLVKTYNEEIIPSLMQKLGVKNRLAVPKIKKVVLNVGLSFALKDKDTLELVRDNLMKITGQKPVDTLSKKSISNFKIREGMVIGMKVTLRGKRMWDFIEKLVKVTLPRVRDFRGISPNSFDEHGNYSLGFKEYIPFPEIQHEDIEKMHGLEVIVATSAKNKEEGKALLTGLGFPFKNEEK